MAGWKCTSTIAPNWHVMDNEAPKELKQAIHDNGCTLELTPPNIHWWNIAKSGIQTCKGHFISILAGLPDDFPIHQCGELTTQTVLTLNLFWPANVAPNVSVYTYQHGQFNYNRMPCAPLGCAVHFTSNSTDEKHGMNTPLMAGN